MCFDNANGTQVAERAVKRNSQKGLLSYSFRDMAVSISGRIIYSGPWAPCGVPGVPCRPWDVLGQSGRVLGGRCFCHRPLRHVHSGIVHVSRVPPRATPLIDGHWSVTVGNHHHQGPNLFMYVYVYLCMPLCTYHVYIAYTYRYVYIHASLLGRSHTLTTYVNPQKRSKRNFSEAVR